MIWLLILIPIIITFFAYKFFPHHLEWYELIAPPIITLILIVICYHISLNILTSDTEYWGSYAVKAEYFEDWNEYIHDTCTRTVTDSQGNSTTETYDCSYVQYHPEYWLLIDNIGQEINITKSNFNRLSLQWNSKPKFINLYRNYHTNDGDKYIISWNNLDKSLEDITTIYKYENKVQLQKGIFGFENIDPETIPVYEYPIVNGYQMNSIVGYNDKVSSRQLSILNAKIGSQLQCRAFIFIFENQPESIGLAQESYLKGGNKNEFITTIGIDDKDNIKWAYIFSWCENERLKINCRNFLIDQGKLNLPVYIDYLGQELYSKWKRKEFTDFDYLVVDIPNSYVIISAIIILLVNIGVNYISIINTNDEL